MIMALEKSQSVVPFSDLQQYYISDPRKFIPKLYNFNLPDDVVMSTANAVAIAPPFWVLVENLIAVVWKLYTKENQGRKVGIMQLQWALELIKMIKDDHGKLTNTLEEVKITIENALISKYAKLPEKSLPDNDKQSSYATSQNVSFSLRDVMSRTAKTDAKSQYFQTVELEGSTRNDGKTCPDGSSPLKSGAPPRRPDKTVKAEEVVNYLNFLKNEQERRLANEEMELEKIEDAIRQVEKGNFDIESWLNKHEKNASPVTIPKNGPIHAKKNKKK